MQISSIYYSVFSISIMIIIGVIAVKARIVTQKGVSVLTNLVFNVTLPALVFSSMVTTYKKEMFFSSFYLPVFAIVNLLIVNYFLAAIFSKILKIEKEQKNIFLFMATFENYTYLPLPLAGMLYGEQGILFVLLFTFAGDILIWTLGIKLFNNNLKPFSLGIFSNMGIISLLLGFLFAVLSDSVKLPDIIIKPLIAVGSTTLPLAMIMTGGILAGTKIKDVKAMLLDKKIVWLTLLKIIITPVIIFLLTGLFNMDPIVKAVIVLEASMPCAFVSIIFCNQYKKDTKFAAVGVLDTTIISLLTIPVFLYMLNM